ncbi:MAG: molybdopterin-dependent oxidoreductase [Proteobacteria bacterium]|nr:molybdopterin-dependent oxidoreductase [Pseudomonadota bacterium]MDA0993193.1 molybdopterin-dependent oxidoreductase [Pseudomonadota bacterium]
MGKWTRRAFISAGVLAGGVVVFGVAIRPGNRADKVRKMIAGEDDSIFNVWVKISPDNSVTAIVPHAEMGQGVHTTLAMMLADEMDADWQQMKMLEAPANKEYANYALAKGFIAGDVDFPSFLVDTVDGFFLTVMKAMNMQITGGSTSVPTTGQLGMRVAGAATRAVLLEAAANAWSVPASELSARKGEIFHQASSRSAPFAEFALQAAALSLPVKPRLKTPDEYTIMGTDVLRLDVPSKVDGTAEFGIDASLPGMKYAAVKAAPVFGTTVKSVDDSSIQDMPGIRKVVNLGDAVVVIADGYWQAQQALDQLKIEFEQNGSETIEQSDIFRQFAADMDKATVDGEEILDFEQGDAISALSAADRIVEAEYRVPYLSHAPMEPMNCTAWMHDNICELWTGTQNPLGFAAEVADALEMDLANVLLYNAYLGGGFGRRAFPDYTIQAARIAAEVPYPVKLIWSREEDMRHDHYRQASISRFRAALDSNGQPTAWINQYVDKHDPKEAPYIPYAIAHQYIHYAESRTHVPWGFWRSVDHSLHAFFTESFIDELAFEAGRDPYQYRHDLLAGAPRFQKVIDLAAEKANWNATLPENWGRGIAIHKSFGTIVAQVVEIEIVAGRVFPRRTICAVDAGFAMHPDGMKAQMESGIVYGLTAALYSDISIRRGAVAQSNFHDYQMLRMNESPEIETYIINSGEKIGGAGEPGTPAIAPALVNAIFNATGKRIRELPVKMHDLTDLDMGSKDVA